MKRVVVVLKYFLLVAVMLVLWLASLTGAAAVVGYHEPAMTEDAAACALQAMLIVCAVNTALLTYTILRSRWRGLRLVGVMALQIFGIQFFLSQIETLYFNFGVKMPGELIAAIVIGGFVLAWVFSFIAVVVLGRMKKEEPATDVVSPSIQPGAFAWRFILLAAIVYPAIYILAGYFIAWQFEDVRVMYTGSAAKAGFGEQFSQAYLQSWLYPYQVLRGAMWVLIALPVIRMMKGGRCETALAVGLLFACLMSMSLLLPNPYMPGDVALAHFLETLSSNFLWGLIVVVVMYRQYAVKNQSTAA